MKTIFMCVCLLMMGCPAKPAAKKDVKWEYGAVFSQDTLLKGTFDNLGKDGWEAVWCRRSFAPGTTASAEKIWGYECLFKRKAK